MAMIGNTGRMKEDLYVFIGFDKSVTFLFAKPFNPAFSHWQEPPKSKEVIRISFLSSE